MKRIVIKIGSNVLTRPDGTLDVTRISSIVDQVQAIRADGAQVLLVSSGAVACGRSLLGRESRKLDPVEQRQLYSAVGQVQLIGLYSRLFKDWNTTIGQVLTMKESFSTRREYLNQRACMEVMLANNVVPVINENDTVSVTELMFTDNDELSGLVASMMDADTLVILSNVDGIYDGPPSDTASKVIAKVYPGDDISGSIGTQKSGFGRGGMRSKYAIAAHAAEEGIRVLIANGKREGIVKDLYFGVPGTVCTEFVPAQGGVSSVKKWIAHSSGFAKGTVTVNAAARDALCGENAVSLLPVGVVSVQGDFEEGDIIGILDPDGVQFAVGRSSYGAAQAKEVIGRHDCRPLVHYDYLSLL
ncbi:MAG: glutamate 5-kinase [Bacteroidales bacterium]|nr:glutamate 5-kinase [Bacteroidales bacterium]